jgi:hypothetical protein
MMSMPPSCAIAAFYGGEVRRYEPVARREIFGKRARRDQNRGAGFVQSCRDSRANPFGAAGDQYLLA